MSEKKFTENIHELNEIPEVDENSFSKDNLKEKSPRKNKNNKKDSCTNKKNISKDNIKQINTNYLQLKNIDINTNNDSLNTKSLKLSNMKFLCQELF